MTQVQLANYHIARWEEMAGIDWLISEAWSGRDWSDYPMVRDWIE